MRHIIFFYLLHCCRPATTIFLPHQNVRLLLDLCQERMRVLEFGLCHRMDIHLHDNH